MANYRKRDISAEQQNRKNRAKYEKMVVHDIDYAAKTAVIESSDGTSFYSVSLSSCTCPDFIKRRMTCKHMYKLQDALQQPPVVSSPAHNAALKTDVQETKTSVTHPDRSGVIYNIVIATIIIAVSLWCLINS